MRFNRATSSVLDHLAPSPTDSARECLSQAAVCSRLAKLVTGTVRAKLYLLKNRNIRVAITSRRSGVEICCDRDLYFGLLSVRLKDGNMRVHTHENWLLAARPSTTNRS